MTETDRATATEIFVRHVIDIHDRYLDGLDKRENGDVLANAAVREVGEAIAALEASDEAPAMEWPAHMMQLPWGDWVVPVKVLGIWVEKVPGAANPNDRRVAVLTEGAQFNSPPIESSVAASRQRDEVAELIDNAIRAIAVAIS